MPSMLLYLIILFTDGRFPWTGDRPVVRPLPKHRTTKTQNKRIHTFEPMIPASELAKTIHALDRAATVTVVNNNSVQFSSLLFMCRANSHKANYRHSTV
jgi:hypothetical protein